MDKKIFLFLPVLLLSLSACKLDYFPSDEVTSGFLTESYEGLCTMTDGVYAMFKDDMEYQGTSSTSYTFCRRAMEMAEFTSDNQIISGRTTSTIFNAYTYENTNNLQNVSYVWWCCYKAIYSANMVIEAIDDKAPAATQALKGECLFLRAFAHLWLCNLYARPYAQGRDNLGVVLRTSTNTNETKRSTVGECFDQIQQDLIDAIELMGKAPRRGNNGYASKEAAQGLLSRVYLQMEKNQECIDLVNEMLGGADPAGKLSSNGIQNFYANTLTDPEALWCIAYTTIDGGALGQSLLAGMYMNDPVSGLGWGEAYASDVLIDLYERYPEDKRYSELIQPQYLDNGKKQARYPVKGVDNREHRDCQVSEAIANADGSYSFKDAEDKTVVAKQELVNTYPLWFATINGEKVQVHIHEAMVLRNSFPKYYISKFSYQDGQAMLASPAMVRWGEVLLNQAEAYAKTSGGEGKALDLVNIIRRRAGISTEGMFTATNMQTRGYATVLDVVLAERQLELAFEGFRTLDIYRNKRNLDRFFPGLHSWESISYEDQRTIYPIPFDEVGVSGIAQNPGY